MGADKFIVIEGVIGVGKTTVAKTLASRMDAKLVLEEVDGNEFLSDFYADEQRWAMGMQLWFLANRYHKLTAEASSSTGPVVADYTYEKDRIFARILLKDRELRLYENLSSALRAQSRMPDLLVNLEASNAVLLGRIRERGRTFETNISENYLNALRNGYEDYFRATPLLKIKRVDTSAFDVRSESDLLRLCDDIIASASS